MIYRIYPLVMTNIAMENPVNKWRFLAGKIIYKWKNQRVINESDGYYLSHYSISRLRMIEISP